MAVQTVQDGFYYRSYDPNAIHERAHSHSLSQRQGAAQHQQHQPSQQAVDRPPLEPQSQKSIPLSEPDTSEGVLQTPVTPTTSFGQTFASPALITPQQEPVPDRTHGRQQLSQPSSSSRTRSTSSNAPPPTEQELLRLVNELRERATRSQQRQEGMNDFRFPPTAGQSASSAKRAGTSPERSTSSQRPGSAGGSEVESLDLSSRRITVLPDVVIERIRDDVVRLALASNRLTTLPQSFAAMGRLRYLNIRTNALTEFPKMLCELPSLEILDVGRNKIKYLPTEPGTLINLKILAVGGNRLKRLPLWIGNMPNLRIAKVIPNPLEWPPADILAPAYAMDKQQEKVKDPETTAEERDRIRKNDDRTNSAWVIHLQAYLVAQMQNGATDEPQSNGIRRGSEPDTAPEAVAVAVAPAPSTSPTRLRRIPTKESLLGFSGNEADKSVEASHPTGLPGAKSISNTSRRLRRVPTKESLLAYSTTEADNETTPQAQFSSVPDPPVASPATATTPHRILRRVPTTEFQRTRSGLDSDDAGNRHAAVLAPAANIPGLPKVDTERNNYFRRVSMLPTSTIDKTVPQAILHVVDALRGVLYALSQIHTALKQYITFAVVPATTASGISSAEGRVSAPFYRVLDIAGASMAQFIDSLDRFDNMCRRGTPPTSVIRDVFVACKDCVQIFGKVTGVLQLQLRALLNTADPRYTRTLLLMLHGSIAEVSNSYRTMAPQIEAVMPYLAGLPVADSSTSFSTNSHGHLSSSSPISSMNGSKVSRMLSSNGGHNTTASTFSTPSLPSIAEQTSPGKIRPLISASRLARNRHAGNFSARDVETGSLIAPAPMGAATGNGNGVPVPGSMEQLIYEEKQKLEAAVNGEEEYGAPPLPPLPLSEISVHLKHHNKNRSRSGSNTGSENGQLLSASSSTGSGGQFDSIGSGGGGGLVSGGGFRRQGPPSSLGALPGASSYQDEIVAGYPRSPGGRPIMLASGSGFGPRRGEGVGGHGFISHEPSSSFEGRRGGYFDHAYSRSMPSRPVRRGRTGSTASIGSAGANSANGMAWGAMGAPPLPHPQTRPYTAGGNPPANPANGSLTPRIAGSASGRKRAPIADDHLLMLTDQLTATAATTWTSLKTYLEGAAQQEEHREAANSQNQAQGDTSTGSAGANGSSSMLSRRMQDLNGQLTGATALTHQLRSTLDTIRAALDVEGHEAGGGGAGAGLDSGMSTVTSTNVIRQPAADIKKLWEDGNVLVRTVVQISVFVKGITSEHDFPREMLRSMGDLTSICSQVMVHMQFLQH
ncbi:RAM signaling network component [Tilletia horrida]|uniref:RAM signaling network component n=1 Tax=Tilletia horrida TaxID=155126 RepID=A0AAN6JTZ5_9BASI|nr:RAM signaling network component [Tilletia horrida]